MTNIKLTINEQEIEVEPGSTLLQAAQSADIYIPHLCSHVDLPTVQGLKSADAIYQGDKRVANAYPESEFKGCGICLVEVEGEEYPVKSCTIEVKEGMIVSTESDELKKQRQDNLDIIVARHPHACIACAQNDGCPRTQCSTNVPENERCCPQLGHCELQDVINYVGIKDGTGRYIFEDLPIITDGPLYARDYNLCIGCNRCVRACSELRGVQALGFVFEENGSIQVGTLAPTLQESGCRFCTACVEICPTGALMDKDVEPATREDDIVPCRANCPANMDIPSYLRLVAEGNADEANCVIREKVPFSRALGRVCFHPCEDACRRVKVNNEPLSICALKRYAADNENGLWKQSSIVKPSTNKRVAIVGAGPAGLTAAFYLKKQGHDITLFDEREKAGGMLRYGIPAYRLPEAVLDSEINDILGLGFEFKPGKKLGENFTLEQLESDGYDAVFLAVGLQESRKIEVPGSDHEDVLWGLEFLAAVAKGDAPELKDRVLVIGGGNVATDVALSALRCNAKDVTMICLESIQEMTASPWEIEEAIHEGVNIESSWGPEEIIFENNAITSVRFKQCTAVFDDKSSFCPIFSDIEMERECDQIIMAIGQAADISFLPKDNSIKSDRGLIVVDLETFETSRKGFFAGGDVIIPPAGSVIEAIVAGRKAAASIDKQLGGDGEIDEILLSDKTPDPYIGKIDGFAELKRVAVPVIPLEGRNNGFDEISYGYDKELAMAEARRCLQCDLRLEMGSNPSVPENIFAMTAENIETVPDNAEGVYQLYDNDSNVIAIKGTATIRYDLFDQLENNENAIFFDYEEDPMFSKRESEMISQYLQVHGELPGGGSDELDDLF